MSALEIEFHCLCLFVPEPEKNLVHVLMPSTGAAHEEHDHGHHHPAQGQGGGGAGQHGHVHDRHHAFIKYAGLGQPVVMEGWALRLGREGGEIDTGLEPDGAVNGAQLIDLNAHTGGTLDPGLLLEQADERVTARVTLREGRLLSTFSDAQWLMKGKPVPMASRSVWRIDDFPDGQLEWKPLTASGEPPLATLDGVDSTDGVRRIHVFHTTREGMASGRTRLTPDEVREHFRVYLELYGIRPQDDPHGVLLPGTGLAWSALDLDPGEAVPVGDDGDRSVGVDCPNGTGRTA
jgi:hypothetical protein